MSVLTPTDRMLLRRGLALVYATPAWNVAGTIGLILAALAGSSVALAGFGVDSLIEIVASTALIGQLNGGVGASRARRAPRIIAVAFVPLAACTGPQTAVTFSSASHPGNSSQGMAWLALTILIRPAFAAGTRNSGARLRNPVLATEARVTVIDAALAAVVLGGVVLNAAAGWWWAYPASALVILVYGLREARHVGAEAA